MKTTDSKYKREYLEGKPITINGPIEVQIHKVMECVEDFLKNATYQIGDNLIKLDYPYEALKEVLVNAVIHRDYRA